MKPVRTAIRITAEDGEKIIINRRIDRIVYTNLCPYSDHEYETEDPNKVFCSRSHRTMHWKKSIEAKPDQA